MRLTKGRVFKLFFFGTSVGIIAMYDSWMGALETAGLGYLC